MFMPDILLQNFFANQKDPKGYKNRSFSSHKKKYVELLQNQMSKRF